MRRTIREDSPEIVAFVAEGRKQFKRDAAAGIAIVVAGVASFGFVSSVPLYDMGAEPTILWRLPLAAVGALAIAAAIALLMSKD